MKRKLSFIMALVLVMSTVFSALCVSAESWPSLSSSKYCEFTAAKQITVYVDSKFSKPGTSNPYKKYSAYISKNDKCYIYKITSKYAEINYPTSSGRKTGYIRTSDLLGKNMNPDKSYTAKKKVTTLKYKNGGETGYYESGDKVYEIPGSNYNVMYTAKSGKRAYKLGYVATKTQNNQNSTKSSSSKSSELKKIKLTVIENYSSLLNSKQKNAESIMKVVNDVNLRLSIEKTLGVSTIATITLNPSKMASIFDKEATIGLVSFTVTEAYYNSAINSHNKFLNTYKNIKNIDDIDKAFEYLVDALSKYNAVIDANIDTVNRYTSKKNYRIDMLNSYFSSVANAAIPASEYKAIMTACEIANTAAELIDTVGSKYAGYSAMQNTRSELYKSWNKFK